MTWVAGLPYNIVSTFDKELRTMHHEVEVAPRRKAGATTGTVIAVCYSAELINGVGKEQHDSAEVTRWGIPGDRHYGETRFSSSARKVVPNNRPITVVGVEGVRDATETLQIAEIPAGGLGENFLVEGLGDLSDLVPGDELRFTPAGSAEPSVVLKVRKQNEPCSNLLQYHRLMVKEMFGKRGVICTVSKEGRVSTGDAVQLVRKKKA
jgi:hypothetical protein